jgi:hypothetical protein
MLIDLFLQFVGEFLRALLIDELSEHVRRRRANSRRRKQLQLTLRLKAGRPTRTTHSLSTDDRQNVG